MQTAPAANIFGQGTSHGMSNAQFELSQTQHLHSIDVLHGSDRHRQMLPLPSWLVVLNALTQFFHLQQM